MQTIFQIIIKDRKKRWNNFSKYVCAMPKKQIEQMRCHFRTVLRYIDFKCSIQTSTKWSQTIYIIQFNAQHQKTDTRRSMTLYKHTGCAFIQWRRQKSIDQWFNKYVIILVAMPSIHICTNRFKSIVWQTRSKI